MGFGSAMRGLFSSKKDEKDEKVEDVCPESFSELKVGNSFTIEICDVMEMCSSSFEVKEEFKYVVSMDRSVQKVLTIESIETGNQFRSSEVTISGNKFIRIDKLLSDDEVVALFLNDEDEDFRHIFSEDLTAAFVMKRFALGEESLIKPLLDWTAPEYKFTNDLGIQGYVEINGHQEPIQYYLLSNAKKDYSVIIENYDDGIAKVYLSHLLAPSNISNFI